MDPDADSQRPLFACIICRARKVKCDKAPSGCTRCRSASEEIDNIYRRAGLERRKAGACHECRAAKAKCSQNKPRCRRCEARDIACNYPASASSSGTGSHRHTRSPSARDFSVPEAATAAHLGPGGWACNPPKAYQDGYSSEIPGRLWGRKARKLVKSLSCISSVQNLMAMVLYAEYGLRIGDNAFVYMIVGCCTRMSRLLRMDEEDRRRSDGLLDDNDDIHGEALTRRESKRRLMWSCYILDSFVGAGVDGNLSWATDLPNIPLACSERNFLHRTNNPPVYAEILRHLRDHTAGNPARAPPWDENSTFMTLLNQVEAWCRELPDFLTFNDINVYIHKEQHTPGSYFSSTSLRLRRLDDHYTPTAAFESTKVHVVYLTTVMGGDQSTYGECIDHINTNLRVLTETHPYSDMPNVYLSALIPLLKTFGFSDIATQWESHQNTLLHRPSRLASDALTHDLFAAPPETAYLNQIATFRLARRRDIASPRTSSSAAAGIDDEESEPPEPRPGAQFMASLEQFVSTEPVTSHGDSSAGFGVTVPRYMDQAEYLRMAAEVGQYMTWDVALPSRFDSPMEEYFSTPPEFEGEGFY
ncbi:unnamed protein product [Parascedosporium putredinis]|uniref:Zn(2)-C6 fungal-type domain-containing protein n=1 Tax=Parascedosporium putredinis TaxID=1442378 RepID=A0A9P1H1F8_9PEZI|nr:unnamed protein product [Parascedosporium putredinis]CAI7993676.1 unnamed protein product [Parascedosporium putredinis]